MNATVLVNPLLVWELATFHAAFFVLLAVFLLYLGGDVGELLGNLNTLVGFGIFLALWFTTWWSTLWLVRSLAGRALTGFRGMVTVFFQGAVWGGVNGVLFLLCLLVGFSASIISTSIAEDDPEQILGLLLAGPVVGAVAAIVAAIVGAVVGLLFGVVDAIVLLTVRKLLPAVREGTDAGSDVVVS